MVMGPQWFMSLVVLLVIGQQGARGQDVRVKLCGREFIRMVVTSCGSSRLRRFAPEVNQQNVNPYRDMLEWLNSDHFSQLKSPENQDATVPEEAAENLQHEDRVTLRSKATEDNTRGVDLSRTRRNAGPAGVCCRSGCTMSELVQYC